MLRRHATRCFVLLVAAATACSDDPPAFIECRDNSSCGLSASGQCIPSEATGLMFCAYPDLECPDSGYRWSDVDVEASVSGRCVPGQDAGPTDMVAPAVVAKAPEDGDDQVTTSAAISVTFSEAIDPETVTATSFTVRAAGDVAVVGSVSVDADGVAFTPDAALDPSVEFTATLTTAIKDLAGNPLASAFTWRFRTRTGGWSAPALLELEQNAAAADLDVAMRNGHGVAVWTMRGCNGRLCGGESRLLASRYADGAWSTPDTLLTSPTAIISGPRVAIDSAGDATVVWYFSETGPASIFASRFEGDAWSEPTPLESEPGLAQLPRVTVDYADNVFVAWLQAVGSASTIYAARYATGTGWQAARRIDGLTQPAGSVNVVAGADGIAHAVWSQNLTLQAARFASGAWETPRTLDPNARATGIPALAIDATGATTVVYASGSDVRSARNTGTWSEPEPIDASDYAVEAGYNLAAAPDGRVIAVWSQADDVHQAAFTPTEGWGSAFRLETTSGDSGGLSIAVGASRGMALWRQANSDTGTVQGNEYRAASGWSGPQRVGSLSGPVTETNVEYDTLRNTFMAVWLQTTSGYQSVYSARYD
jgi:hypothetical protein